MTSNLSDAKLESGPYIVFESAPPINMLNYLISRKIIKEIY